ncbi:LysM peptidoglycan-binding domain-containing protein [Lederbergia sp. NSJ-179]|uniref:LysM peptidoglycan-binding domain-containing protein n=1 Tax=Lederbergia sp. NSJ-179 TaxID=2931402 RepID=UPI001FD06524|nr:LysM peptidoglycan-binding domain-containing protein [Lederbergia sp. NSJ-179]MCJ7842003.1 LysM peptidoglycan-binding domain-containing protein [Lederbergia sp. NSJ-179]
MKIHVVRSGDVLWQIAREYGADLNQIILANEISDPNALVVGQSLVIPEPGKEYVVQSGDDLWRISSQHGVSIQELSRVNNITDPNILYIGQVLQIPYSHHVVQRGETLWEIAQRYGLTVNQIAQANNITNLSAIGIGQTLRIPTPARPVTEVNAYTTRINEQGAGEIYLLGRNFTYLSPFMHSVREDGTLTELQDAPILAAAHANNVAPLFVITNFRNSRFDSDLAAAILRNQTLQDTLITNIIDTMQAKGYQGLNIDFEYVYPEDRENYNAFLRKVVSRLHPEGFSVSTALAPKESGEQQGLLYEAHDYRAQGQIVDFIILMTYEWGWAGGRPWAIAPINKVRDVLDYAVTVIPREKIVMGAPLYGRDWNIPWVQGTTARTISPQQGVTLARRYGEAIQYNETYQAPFFRYTDENGQRHEVWFEDARSMQAKYDVVKEYGLRGISYWVLGNPFPQNWPVLRDNFTIRKL